jgi:hypothetical protein
MPRLEQSFTIEVRQHLLVPIPRGDIAFAQYTTEPTESSFTNPEGKFELQLGPGAFDLTASAEEYVEGKAQVVVQEGGTTDVKIFVSKQGAVVAGRVSIRSSGNPQGTSVYLIQSASETEAMTRALMGGEISGGEDARCR